MPSELAVTLRPPGYGAAGTRLQAARAVTKLQGSRIREQPRAGYLRRS
jgi:hypothetical protein